MKRFYTLLLFTLGVALGAAYISSNSDISPQFESVLVSAVDNHQAEVVFIASENAIEETATAELTEDVTQWHYLNQEYFDPGIRGMQEILYSRLVSQNINTTTAENTAFSEWHQLRCLYKEPDLSEGSRCTVARV